MLLMVNYKYSISKQNLKKKILKIELSIKFNEGTSVISRKKKEEGAISR